jgi:hypothetical protein
MSKVQPEEYLDPLDEKTPTSVYMPQFDSGMRLRASSKCSVPAQGTEPATDLINAGHRADIDEPTVIIASEIMGDYGCDGVADTVAVVRHQRWSALSLALIAGLSGLFAISLGILLADFYRSCCNIPRNEDPQSSAQGASVTQAHDRSNSAHP